MRGQNALKNEAVARALDKAIAGDPRPLYSELARLSGLPGPRANMGVLDAFAGECALRGERVDGVLIALAKLDADHAPGATPLEFLPMCGVAGIGARAALDASARPSSSPSSTRAPKTSVSASAISSPPRSPRSAPPPETRSSL